MRAFAPAILTTGLLRPGADIATAWDAVEAARSGAVQRQRGRFVDNLEGFGRC